MQFYDFFLLCNWIDQSFQYSKWFEIVESLKLWTVFCFWMSLLFQGFRVAYIFFLCLLDIRIIVSFQNNSILGKRINPTLRVDELSEFTFCTHQEIQKAFQYQQQPWSSLSCLSPSFLFSLYYKNSELRLLWYCL